MQTQVGLGFAWLSLNDGQRERIRAIWKSHPLGRFLLPYEIAKILRIEFKRTVKDEEAGSMYQTWIDFCRNHNKSQDDIPSDHDEWFMWLDFVIPNYQEPLPVASGGDWNDK